MIVVAEQKETSDDKRGLGRVVYSTEPAEVRQERTDDSDSTDAIEEASEESFPSSDPPGYSRGAPADPDIDPGSQAATEHPPASQATNDQLRPQPATEEK